MNKRYIENEESIVICLRNQFEGFDENVETVKNFYLNLFFLLINGSSFNSEKELSKKERDTLQNLLRKLSKDKKIKNIVKNVYT